MSTRGVRRGRTEMLAPRPPAPPHARAGSRAPGVTEATARGDDAVAAHERPPSRSHDPQTRHRRDRLSYCVGSVRQRIRSGGFSPAIVGRRRGASRPVGRELLGNGLARHPDSSDAPDEDGPGQHPHQGEPSGTRATVLNQGTLYPTLLNLEQMGISIGKASRCGALRAAPRS
jgi:hypothetical protein